MYVFRKYMKRRDVEKKYFYVNVTSFSMSLCRQTFLGLSDINIVYIKFVLNSKLWKQAVSDKSYSTLRKCTD